MSEGLSYAYALPNKERKRNCEILSFQSVIQFALIHALLHQANGTCSEDRYDGFYKFRGSIDTRLIAEALAQAAREKVLYELSRQV